MCEFSAMKNIMKSYLNSWKWILIWFHWFSILVWFSILIWFSFSYDFIESEFLYDFIMKANSYMISFFWGRQTFNGTLQIFSQHMLFTEAKFQLLILSFQIFIFFLGVLLPVPRHYVIKFRFTIHMVESRTRIVIRLPGANRFVIVLGVHCELK